MRRSPFAPAFLGFSYGWKDRKRLTSESIWTLNPLIMSYVPLPLRHNHCHVKKAIFRLAVSKFVNEVHDLCVHRKLSTRKTDLRLLNLPSTVLLNNSFTAAAAFKPPANTRWLYYKLLNGIFNCSKMIWCTIQQKIELSEEGCFFKQ